MSERVSWDALRAFVAVARAGSFSAAAQTLGLAQSSLSEQVARLERTLGHRLVDRGPTGVRTTSRGRALLARIEGPVEALAEATAPQGTGRERRTVILGGPAEFLSEVVLPRLPEHLPRGQQVTARFGDVDDLAEELRGGLLDVLVSTVPVRGQDLMLTPVYDERFVLVAHPRWVQAAARSLAEIPVLSYGPELPIIRRYWRSVFGHRPSDLVVSMIAPDLRSLRRLAIAGAGMTVLPHYLVQNHLEQGDLIELHRPETYPINTLCVVSRRPQPTPDPAVRSLREAVRTICRGAQGHD